MFETLHPSTTVLEGGRVELTLPGATAGDEVEMTVVRRPATGRSALDVIASLGGRRLFADTDAVDRHVRAERESWE